MVRVNGSRGKRESMVAFVAFRPRCEPRLFAWHKSGQGYVKEDFPLLLTMLHARLGSPVSLVWDDYSSHLAAHVRQWMPGRGTGCGWCSCRHTRRS